MLNAPWRFHIPIHLRREVVTLAMLTGLAVVLLIGVTALSELFYAQQDSLAERWTSRGTADLDKGDYKAAVNDFHTSLRYARDGYPQQLGLAEALLGLHHTNEASVYLENLWEQQPENGIVNRELARIAAGKGDTRTALRYYHNAIYASWRGDAEEQREATRWELIKYLLSIKAPAQAQSELINLGVEVGEDPAQQLRLGQYFLKVQDGQHALAAFHLGLRSAPHNSAALAGAGEAEFDLGDYAQAHRYLAEAMEQNPSDRDSASLLEVTTQVIRLNPYRAGISDADRDQAVLSAFQTAGERLKACPALADSSVSPANVSTAPVVSPAPPAKAQGVLGTLAAALAKLPSGKKKSQSASPAPQAAQQQPQPSAGTSAQPETLAAAWAQLEPKVTISRMRHNQDVVNDAMNLAFRIERHAALQCGPGTPADTALVLISKSHEGS